ncbi:MAG: MFS transporter [Dehalococcoidia bacterium]|nr:MAG: MFS transporter [Dehalococcoidia bacterium]
MREAADTGTGAKAGEFSRIDYLKIAIFGFALSALWGSLHSVVLQVRLLDFVAESQKNTYLGLLTFTGLVVAMAVQPVAGAISDRSSFSWGRRRPYILLGTIAAIFFLSGIGFSSSFATILIFYCLLQASSNTAQASYQGFIPDLVPEGKRGIASGVKSLLEIVGGVALLYLLALFMDRYRVGEGDSWLWLALGILAIVLLGALLATVLTVKERPGTGGAKLPLLPTLYRSFKIDVRANRDFILFLVSRLLIFMAFTTLQTFALYFFMDVVGVADPATAVARFSIVAVAGMLVAVYPAGRLSDRVGRRPIVVTSGLLGALGISLIFLFQHSHMLIMLGGGLVGISFGAFLSTNWALATDLVAKGEEARYLGLTNLATAGGAALARLIGPVIDFFNVYGPGLGYQVMLLACFIYFVVGSLLVIKIKLR